MGNQSYQMWLSSLGIHHEANYPGETVACILKVLDSLWHSSAALSCIITLAWNLTHRNNSPFSPTCQQNIRITAFIWPIKTWLYWCLGPVRFSPKLLSFKICSMSSGPPNSWSSAQTALTTAFIVCKNMTWLMFRSRALNSRASSSVPCPVDMLPCSFFFSIFVWVLPICLCKTTIHSVSICWDETYGIWTRDYFVERTQSKCLTTSLHGQKSESEYRHAVFWIWDVTLLHEETSSKACMQTREQHYRSSGVMIESFAA